MVIPEIVGSAALPHLRFLAATVWSLVSFACVAALVGPVVDDPPVLVGTGDISLTSPLPPIVADRTPLASGPGLVTVTSRGGVHPAGSAALPAVGEPIGSSPEPLPSPPPVGIAATGAGPCTSGYVLHADGVLNAFGGAPVVAERPAGGGTVVDVAAGPSGAGGWVISAQGGAHGFGGQGDRVVGTGSAAVIAGDLTDSGDGYLLEVDGRLRTVGLAPGRQIAGPVQAVDVAVRPGGDSGWVLSTDGRLHGFGGAPQLVLSGPTRHGSARSYRAVVVAGGGRGGWVATDDGQIWPFGNERPLPTTTTATGTDTVDAAIVGSVQAPSFSARGPGAPISDLCGAAMGRECYLCVTIGPLADQSPRTQPVRTQ